MFDKIDTIRFKNYKSFTGSAIEEMDFSKPVNVFIGKNNTGKSSILDIIDFLYSDINTDEGRKKLGKQVDQGTVFQFGYDLQGVLIKQVDPVEPLTKGKALAWYEAESYETYSYFSSESANKWSPIINNPQNEDLKSDRRRILEDYYKLLSNIYFRRINADRDIVPEVESYGAELSFNGSGTTNLIRRFIIDAAYDEKIVEEILLSELNKIMGPDAQFERIHVQQFTEGDIKKWEVYLQEKGQPRFPLSKTGSGLKTIILMLVNLFLIPALSPGSGQYYVYAFEELENNLHPALQRRVFDYLCSYAENHGHVRIFLTTHSPVAINIFGKRELALLHHVEKDGNCSTINSIGSYYDKLDILEDLDIKPSDILQSNGIIWVEGPSDRLYIKRWLDLFTDSRFVEGRDYQFLYYGGKLLSHYELIDEEAVESKRKTDGLISILKTNRNAVIVMDSDNKKLEDAINKTKQAIKKAFADKQYMCWVTYGKEVENYLTARSINEAYNSQLTNDIGRYEIISDYLKGIRNDFSFVKVPFARKVALHIMKADFRDDLEEKIRELVERITKWNE